MFKLLDILFADKKPVTVTATSLALIFLIALIDYITGYELAFSIFYGVPIAITAWYVNKPAGIGFSVLSAIIWAFVDYRTGHTYSHEWILYWNTGVRLGFFIIIAVLLAELKTHLEYEKKLARTDSLTGIMNAHAFREITATIVGIGSRQLQPFTLAYIDLDNFKLVNDHSGHGEGDRVLKTVATILKNNIRSSDFTGRLGGDEFAVLLPATHHDGARQVFSKIQEQLKCEVEKQNWPIGFSIGIAVFAKSQVKFDEAFKFADELMYKVKRSGKNNLLVQEY